MFVILKSLRLPGSSEELPFLVVGASQNRNSIRYGCQHPKKIRFFGRYPSICPTQCGKTGTCVHEQLHPSPENSPLVQNLGQVKITLKSIHLPYQRFTKLGIEPVSRVGHDRLQIKGIP